MNERNKKLEENYIKITKFLKDLTPISCEDIIKLLKSDDCTYYIRFKDEYDVLNDISYDFVKDLENQIEVVNFAVATRNNCKFISTVKKIDLK